MPRSSLRALALVGLAAIASPVLVAQSIVVHSAFATPAYEDTRSMGGPNLLLAIRTTIPQICVAMRLEVFTGERTGVNTLALWSNDPVNNRPLQNLGQGSWSMSRENGWQGAMLSLPVVLLANDDVWLVWGCQNGAQASSVGVGTASTGAQPYRASFDGGQTWNGPYQSVQWKFRIWTGSPAHLTAFGAGCAGSNGTPEFHWVGTPFVGTTYDLYLHRGPVNGFAILGLGFSDTQSGPYALPYPLGAFGAPGCDVLVSPKVTGLVPTDAMGEAVVPMALVNDPAFAGQPIFHQWFCLDVGANALGLSVSNGVAGIVGW